MTRKRVMTGVVLDGENGFDKLMTTATAYRTVRLTQLKVDALYADDLNGHARALFHMLTLLTHEEAAAGKMTVRVSLDAVAELLAGAVAEGEEAFYGLTGLANAHPSANPYLDQLGNHVRGHCLLRGWERLAAHTLALIVLLRSGDDEEASARCIKSFRT